jgi:hypothetical protein
MADDPKVASYATKEKPSPKEVLDFHTHADLDGSPKAAHHTLGAGPNQAAAGNHSHDGGGSVVLFPLEGVVISGAKTGNPAPALASVIAALTALGATDSTGP